MLETLCLPVPAGSLASYCDATFGQLCVDEQEDPACPALFRSDNRWFISSQKQLLCDTTCLTVLCRMQEKAKAEVKGEARAKLPCAYSASATLQAVNNTAPHMFPCAPA